MSERYANGAKRTGGRVKIAAMFLIMALAAAGAPASRAQHNDKCNESTVRRKSELPMAEVEVPDIYANTLNSKGPLLGKAEVEALRKANLT